MIVRIYKKYVLDKHETEMEFIDGLADGILTMETIIIITLVIV